MKFKYKGKRVSSSGESRELMAMVGNRFIEPAYCLYIRRTFVFFTLFDFIV